MEKIVDLTKQHADIIQTNASDNRWYTKTWYGDKKLTKDAKNSGKRICAKILDILFTDPTKLNKDCIKNAQEQLIHIFL